MSTPSARIMMGLAGLALFTSLAIFFFPDSDGVVNDAPPPASGQGKVADDLPASGPESVPASPELPGAGTEPIGRKNAEEDPSAKFDPGLAALSLTVVDSAGDAIADAEVLVIANSRSREYGGYGGGWIIAKRLAYDPDLALASARTGANGVAILEGLTPHSGFLGWLRADGYASVEFECQSEETGKLHDLGAIPLGPSAHIEVEVVEHDGTPVTGTEVRVSIFDTPFPDHYSKEFPPITMSWADTGVDGVAHVLGLPQMPGFDYGFGGEVLSGDAKFEPIGERDEKGGRIRIIVPPTEWATGRVIDTEGNPVVGAQITMGRFQSWDFDEGDTEEQLRETSPSRLWGSHTSLSDYASEVQTDAQGAFRAKIPHAARFSLESDPIPDLISATVLIGDDFAITSKWRSPNEVLDITVPVMFQVTGWLLDPMGKPMVDAEVVFHKRPGPGETKPPPESFDYSYRFDPSPGACDPQGAFVKNLLPDHYWLEVLVPGGRHLFPGPYLVNAPMDLGDIEIPAGRAVRIVAQAADPSRKIQGLEGERSLMPSEEGRSRPSLLGGSGNKETAPWGERDWVWSRSSADADVVEETATWRNQPDGDWRYLLQAPGFVPAIVDLNLVEETGDQDKVVVMEATGQVRVHLAQRTGEAAAGVTVQLSPATGIPMHPMHEELRRTRRTFHDIEQKEQPDSEGIVRFRDVFPGEYEIISIEGEKEGGFLSPPPDLDRPVLATFQVHAGQTTEVEASLAAMAEVRVMVMRNGQILPEAEVFAVVKQDDPWGLGRILDPEPSGTTGPDGSLLITSLAPRKPHWIGARLASDSLQWGFQEAWTKKEVFVETGTQDVILELASGGIHLQVTGSDIAQQVQVTVIAVNTPTEIPSDADEEVVSRLERMRFFQELEGEHEGLFLREIAARRASLNERVEFHHLPPGEYRVLATIESDKRSARAISDSFRIESESHDLGVLTLIELMPTRVQIAGISDLDEDIRRELFLGCFPVGSKRATENTMWVREERAEEWNLPPGAYELVLYYEQIEVARSSQFMVGADGPTEYTWTVPALNLGGQ